MSATNKAHFLYFGNYIHASTVSFRALDSKGNDVITPPWRGLLKTRFRERAHGLYLPCQGGFFNNPEKGAFVSKGAPLRRVPDAPRLTLPPRSGQTLDTARAPTRDEGGITCQGRECAAGIFSLRGPLKNPLRVAPPLAEHPTSTPPLRGSQ